MGVLLHLILQEIEVKRSNCLIFALSQWFKYGGYLMIRKSAHGWYPHFLWSPVCPKEALQFTNNDEGEKLLPPPLFKGFIKHGDD